MGPKEKKIRLYMPNIERVLTSWAFVSGTQEWNVKLADIIGWLSNFMPSEIESAIKIMGNIQYYDDNRIRTIITKLSNKINSILGDEIENTIFFPLGTSSASSGSMYLYQYRKELRLSENNFKRDSFENYLRPNTNIIFFDDIIGSGNQATRFFNKHLKGKSIQCYYFSLLGLECGISYIRNNTQFKMVIAGEELSSEEMAFTENSHVFNKEEQYIIKPICEKYGNKLYSKYPLGYDDTQALIVFPHNTPNNTLPIIWASDDNEAAKAEIQWNPLWNRKKILDKNAKKNQKKILKSDFLYNTTIEQCNEISNSIFPNANTNMQVIKEQEGDSCYYNISSSEITIFLKIARNLFFDTDDSILIWLYKNKFVLEEATFNAILKQDAKSAEVQVINLGLFLNKQDLEIHYASIADFVNNLFKEIAILIR